MKTIPPRRPHAHGVVAPLEPPHVDARVAALSVISIGVGLATAFVAQGLGSLIALVTNLAFHGRLSTAPSSPLGHRLGAAVVLVPAIGGLVVGFIARYGSPGIRGHGIPEAMEQVLFNRSRVPFRITWLKPLSAAISIGTGGPFGAEGPIIATGGALGSIVGQTLTVTAQERKTLLAAGAAAGMAATFGTPVSAVLLAIELLLFEYRARSIVPVALAAAAAAGARIAIVGGGPMFAIPDLRQPGGAALAAYVALGALAGLASIAVTRAVYAVEDAFARLPVHWCWWPALGGIAVGAIGWLSPRTLGVGYDNIERVLSGGLAARALLALAILKLASWSIALGSGTSGGTLAPMFTIGGGLGAAAGAATAILVPALGVEPRVAGLVGMAAMFAGASRAPLASVVFAFEATRQPLGLLPLLAGCSAAHLVSSLGMRHSIMTEKIARRGMRVGAGYAADFLDQVAVGDCASRPAVALTAADALVGVRAWLAAGSAEASHQGFPVLDERGDLVGVVTRRDLLDATRGATRVGDLVRRTPAVAFEDTSLRDAVDHMVREGVGRLPVVRRDGPRRVVGMLTRSDVLEAQRGRIEEAHRREPGTILPLRRREIA